MSNYKKIWDGKPSLRKIYENYYSIIEKNCSDGNVLEIGAGIGNLNLNSKDIIRIDIQFSDSISVVADAHFLPFADNSFNNIIMIDVLHHIECPIKFFKEAARVLNSNGNIIMIEPGITPLSWLMYKLAHDEPVKMNWVPKNECIPNPNKNPYDSNQAIPTLLFGRYLSFFESHVDFVMVHKKWLSLFAYPLSGGFQTWSLISNRFVKKLLNIEAKILPILGPIMAFRLFIVLVNKK